MVGFTALVDFNATRDLYCCYFTLGVLVVFTAGWVLLFLVAFASTSGVYCCRCCGCKFLVKLLLFVGLVGFASHGGLYCDYPVVLLLVTGGFNCFKWGLPLMMGSTAATGHWWGLLLENRP
jgi:hypothetical protein